MTSVSVTRGGEKIMGQKGGFQWQACQSGIHTKVVLTITMHQIILAPGGRWVNTSAKS